MTMTGSSPATANVDLEADYGCHAHLPPACYYCRQHPTSAFSLFLPRRSKWATILEASTDSNYYVPLV